MRPTAHEGAGKPQVLAPGSNAVGARGRFGVRPLLYVGLCAALSLLYLCTISWGRIGDIQPQFRQFFEDNDEQSPFADYEYAIRNPVAQGCNIPDFDPYDQGNRKVYHRVKRPKCANIAPVTRLDHSGPVPELLLDLRLVQKFYRTAKNYSCCYWELNRHQKNPDQSVEKSKCFPIKERTPLTNTTEFILVSCKNPGTGQRKEKVFYKNAHALVPDKESVTSRLANPRTNPDLLPVSVLLIGIDSISRLNMMRTMPKTTRHLHDNGWFELRGYNKIGDNTYPNVMALLTGYNSSDAYGICKPTTKLGLDSCPLIWRNFSDKGYVTAYGEDLPQINTFNYHKKGFFEQPTDYYMRPLFLGMQSYLPKSRQSYSYFCTGPVPAAQRIYDYAVSFTARFRDDPFFGMFWLNSFSHDDVNLPSVMDGDTQEFLDRLQQEGVLDASVVFFFSDHGIRFGKSRELFSGFYEDRLPFFFAWFPPWFRERYPDLVRNFSVNTNRLTTPYDFHSTLKHLLSLSEPSAEAWSHGSRGCPNSDSLLRPISEHRTCAMACIDPHWCTCGDLEEHDPNTEILKKMAEAAVEHLNNVELLNQTLCARLDLHRVVSARSLQGADGSSHQHILVFETTPGHARFEATVYRPAKHIAYEVQDQISRLNAYAGQSDCIKIDIMKKYCFCKK